jgi:hypothetical protein
MKWLVVLRREREVAAEAGAVGFAQSGGRRALTGAQQGESEGQGIKP